jgi:hypothetical protein
MPSKISLLKDLAGNVLKGGTRLVLAAHLRGESLNCQRAERANAVIKQLMW